MKLPQTGGCLCGALRYEITEAPQMVYTCHCTDCQRLTSSAFSMAIVVADGAFQLTRGEPRPQQKTADSGRVNTVWICPQCGSWICGAPTPGSVCACRPARWTTLPGCGRRCISGPATNSPGVALPEGNQSFATQPADLQGFLSSTP